MRFRAGDYSSDEMLDVSELFSTGPGKRFGEQVNQVMDFATKGNLLTVLSSIMPFVEAIMQTMAAGAFSKAIRKMEKKPPPQDLTLVEDMESLLNRVDGMNIREGMEALPSAEDRSWYFSLIIFALYTYLDVYSRSLVDLINNNEKMTAEIENYLSEIAEKRSDKSRPPVIHGKGMKRFGIKRRLLTIENGLSLNSILFQVVGENEMKILREGVVKFIDIRGKVAHSNPKLEHEEYTFEELEKDLAEIELDFSELDKFIEKIGFTQYGLPQIKNAALEIGGVLRKTQLILLTSVVYPALLDAVLQAIIESE